MSCLAFSRIRPPKCHGGCPVDDVVDGLSCRSPAHAFSVRSSPVPAPDLPYVGSVYNPVETYALRSHEAFFLLIPILLLPTVREVCGASGPPRDVLGPVLHMSIPPLTPSKPGSLFTLAHGGHGPKDRERKTARRKRTLMGVSNVSPSVKSALN